MIFAQNLQLLKATLKIYGWSLTNEDDTFEYFTNEINLISRFSFPKNNDDVGYVFALKITLNRIAEHLPEVAQLPLMAVLLAQAENYKQKYSKNKKKWILSEPNSKYLANEIPQIYIPKEFYI